MNASDRQRIERGLRALGISSGDFQAVQKETTLEGATARLEEVKEKVRKAYKKLAFELHPDRTGNDPQKTELFQIITSVKSDIESLTITRTPILPKPVEVPVVVVTYQGVGRPPVGHPAAGGGVRQWGQGTGSASTTISMYPVGVHIYRGPKRNP